VSDPEGHRGFVGLAGGRVTALELRTGALIWSRPALGEPLAANASRLVTVDEADGEVVLRVINAQTGQEITRVSPLDLPSWAPHVMREPDAARFSAVNEGAAIRVFWSFRQPYRGGAPPGPTIAAARAGEPITGSILLDPARGTLLDKGKGGPPVDQPEDSVSDDPNVLAQERIRDRVYALKVVPRLAGADVNSTGSDITIEARSAASGEVEWKTPVGSDADLAPEPLRR
jgi:hypothetical protein